jgi:hypothetical protein
MKILFLIFPNTAITFDLIKIGASNLDENVHLEKLYNFHAGLIVSK